MMRPGLANSINNRFMNNPARSILVNSIVMPMRMPQRKQRSKRTETIPSIKEIRCTSWEDFKTRIMREYAEVSYSSSAYDLDSTYSVFRGHASTEWRLASQWERRISRGVHSLFERSTWRSPLHRIL